MAAESSRSSSTADSYIGSLISLTSKSEIRYEGVLSHINTEESSIGLHNVRSFGTEGRKKDGPQVMPSDKVYEYILFRGSDIKDLQVKSSPPVQQAPPINSDPAIIQSHYPRAASTPSSIPSTGTASLSDISTHPTQLGHPGSTFQSGLPLYQPGGNIGSWGPSPQNANNSGLAMPMYWPGYYGPTNGLPLHQQSLLRPPAGLSMPPSMQQYPGFNAPLPTGSSTSSLTLTSTSLSASNFPSNLPPVPPMMLASEPLPTLVPNRPAIPVAAGSASTATATLIANLPSLSNPDVNAVVPPTISNKPNLISAPPLTYQPISHPVSSITGNSSLVVQTETPTPPPLVTPGQLIQSGQASLSQTVAQAAHKDVEVVQVSPTPTPPASEPLQAPIATEAQPPILPLPSPSRTVQKPNGAHYQARHNYRGRERGRGSVSSRPTMKFTEEFDFTAMNEKFNKDEVWGHLGRSNKSSSKEKVGDGNGSDEYDSEDEDDDDAQLPKIEVKPVYSKDDFFDTLSCNSLDNQSNNGGRTRFSEQRKIDTETFGEFSRYRGGWGGRGPGRGGRSRGGYGYGSRGYGYGYGGRGRGGRNMGNRDF